MLKEIDEQPRVVRDTLVGRMTPAGELDIDELGLSLEELNDIDRVYVICLLHQLSRRPHRQEPY